MSTYYEVEFVCANSEFPKSTSVEAQKNLYTALKSIPGVIPLFQNWSDAGCQQTSLTAIYKTPASEKLILDAARKYHVQVDVISPVSNQYVNRALRGEHERQID